jgi:hypothetical protein
MGLRVVGAVAGPVPFRKEWDEDPRLANFGRDGMHVRVAANPHLRMSEFIFESSSRVECRVALP